MKLPFKKHLPNSYLVGVLVISFLVRIYIFSRRKEDATQLDVYNIIQIAITLILGLTLIVRKDFLSILKTLMNSPIGWLIMLYFFGIISGLWSAIPLFSSYFGVEGIIYVFALAIIFYHQYDKIRMERLAIASSYLLIVFMAAEVVKNNGLGLQLSRWHTNTYSLVAAMLFGYCFGEYNNQYREKSNEEKKLLKRGILVSVFFVVLGTSAASNIALVGALMVVTIISGKTSFKILSIFLFGLVLLINQFYGNLISEVLFPGKTGEEVALLHGRINLWEYYFDLIQQKPWTGWGFAAISRISKLYNIHAHNSFIEILGGVGIVGVVFFAIYFIRVYYRFLTNIRTPYLVGVLGAITAGIINSNAISFLGSPTTGLFLGFIIWNLLGWFSLIKINPENAEETDYITD